jgi:uncharacterized protein YndB with AHSA1/START domain
MHFDVARHVGAVTRRVEDREHEGKPARAVIATRLYPTGIEDAWDALTSAERIPRWFMPISGELRLGGRYQLEGNAGGTITACEPPRRLAVTWEFGGGTSWVYVTLAEAGEEETRIELEHVAVLDDQYNQFWDQFGPGAVGVGWDLSILGLASHLETGSSVAPEAAKDWTGGDNYRDYVAASSRGWREASVAYGTDTGAAGEAADRTTAFYTGSGGHDHDGEGGAAA